MSDNPEQMREQLLRAAEQTKSGLLSTAEAGLRLLEIIAANRVYGPEDWANGRVPEFFTDREGDYGR